MKINSSATRLAFFAGRMGWVAGVTSFSMALAVYVFFGGYALEENIGLSTLYAWRGTRQVPPQVAVVAIDQRSAKALGLQLSPVRWPRDVHAHVVERLHAAGADLIVFDLFFRESRPWQDAVLAGALRHAGNVYLYGFLHRERIDAQAAGAPINREVLESSTLLLAQAAGAVAPFPLPKLPARVAEFWTYRTAAGDMPTLAILAVQYHLRHAALRLPADATPVTPGAHAARSATPASVPEPLGRCGFIPSQ